MVEVCAPECNFPETGYFPKNPGNFPSRAFGNILFPVPTQNWHSGLAVSQSCLRSETFGNSRMFPELKVLGLELSLLKLGGDTINTINRKKTLEKENEEERPIVQTLFTVLECL